MRLLGVAPLAYLLCLTACLALALGGCGGGGSSASSESSTTTASAPTTQGTNPGSATESGGDNSIQTYGSAAAGAEKAEVGAAAHSFFASMASSDYAKLCNGLLRSNREQLQAFLKAKHQHGGCPTVLKTLIPPSETAVARKAAKGAITGVRIKGDTAFVLFRPSGGPESYFVMKRENGEWKAIGLAPGTPLNPSLPGG